MNLIQKVQLDIIKHNLISKKDKLLLSLSTGPDSMFLFYVLKNLNYKFDICFINYNLRKQSKYEMLLANNIAYKNNINLHILNICPIYFNQNNYRKIRNEFYTFLINKYKYTKIALAHTLDDKIETLLCNLIKGAGLEGLNSLNFKSGYFIRPLLNISKQEILSFLKTFKIKYFKDITNYSNNNYLRNKIRNILIPTIDKIFYKNSYYKIKNLINILEDLENILNKNVNLNKLIIQFKKNFYLKKTQLLSLTNTEIAHIFKKVCKDLFNIILNKDQIDTFLYFLTSNKDKNYYFISKHIKIYSNNHIMRITYF